MNYSDQTTPHSIQSWVTNENCAKNETLQNLFSDFRDIFSPEYSKQMKKQLDETVISNKNQ